MTRHDLLPWIALLAFGAGWGIMQPLTKMAVEGGFEPFGIMVWQGAIALILAGTLASRVGLPSGRAQWMFCRSRLRGGPHPDLSWVFVVDRAVRVGVCLANRLSSDGIWHRVVRAAAGREVFWPGLDRVWSDHGRLGMGAPGS